MAAPANTLADAARHRAAPPPHMAQPEDAFAIIETKPPNHVSFYFRRRRSAQVFLLVPARCAGQPRFWCFWVHRCLPGGAVDSTKEPWVSPERLRREELAVSARAIHDDIEGWLKGKGRQTLRRWILDGAVGAD